MAENKILEVKDLCCSYQKSVGLFGKKGDPAGTAACDV